jgi:hypothetical protein
MDDVTGLKNTEIGFIARELERIRAAVRERQATNSHSTEYRELYAAQQALAWALEPNGFRAPYDTILDTLPDSEDCQVNRNRQ